MIQEQAGYALASWARFDGAVGDTLLKAISGAFALVATADGDLAKSEIESFMQVLHQNGEHLPVLDLKQVEHLFRDITGALLSDPVSGRAHALECVAGVVGRAEQCELVRSAAEIAVAADQRTLDKEQEVLVQICTALQIAPR